MNNTEKRQNTKPLFPFNEWLREELKITGMSQFQLSLELGINQGQVSGYINGKTDLRLSSMEKILNVFGYTLKSITVEGL